MEYNLLCVKLIPSHMGKRGGGGERRLSEREREGRRGEIRNCQGGEGTEVESLTGRGGKDAEKWRRALRCHRAEECESDAARVQRGDNGL